MRVSGSVCRAVSQALVIGILLQATVAGAAPSSAVDRCPASEVDVTELLNWSEQAARAQATNKPIPPLPGDEYAVHFLNALAPSAGTAGIARMLQAGASPNACLIDMSWLGYATVISTPAQVRYLLDRGARPDEPRDSDGGTPLMSAIAASRWDNAHVLLDLGASAVAMTDGGMTALHLLAMASCPDGTTCPAKQSLAKRLLAMKTPVNARVRRQGTTALMLAALRGDVALIELLLADGADPSLKNQRGKTALMLAEQADRREAAALLRQHGKAPKH
ncbi:hypothetical protein GCM10007860_29960 [Chitiniphilus shinanonensis]|uniref:Ankyrin repeat domain-containing protein n=1 Tax=Chitiniphilus shinanonensis TaxID=553088 RepID=A0ABQ6BWQ2_9NEIS|nr:hypothetical protein GCM10007860_29960 [Chitiniphilus shinanonensis]